jgi:hypothetical protein
LAGATAPAIIDDMKRLESLRAGCRFALLAGALVLAWPTIGRASTSAASPATSCNPFCGVLHFMTPPARAAVRPIHTVVVHRRIARPVRVVRVLPALRPPYAVASLPPPAYPRIITPGFRYWQAAYPVYVYPGYRYVYYYIYPYGYRAY